MPLKTKDSRKSESVAGWSIIQPYIKEIDRIPLLSANQEKSLARRVSNGDAEAREILIQSNLRLVVNTAKHYVGRGVGLEDLIEEGNLGLMRAVESFDPEASTRFSTYAVYWVKQSMRRAIMNQGRTVRFPAYLVSLMSKWGRASQILHEDLGREPTNDEVAEFMELPPKKRELVFLALQVIKGLPGRIESCLDEEVTRGETISDMSLIPVEDLVDYQDCLDRIFRAMGYLDDLEAELIRLRYGLDDGSCMGIQDVAQRLSITRDRARYVERRALNRLKSISRSMYP